MGSGPKSVSPLSAVGRQGASPGGDEELHHPVSGQRGVPHQHAGQQCAADAGHPGLAAPPHGKLRQPHFTGLLGAQEDPGPPVGFTMYLFLFPKLQPVVLGLKISYIACVCMDTA